MRTCKTCKYFKPYEKINGGTCLSKDCRLIFNDIEYPESWGCNSYKTNKANLIERFIKWITKGKY